MIGSQKVLRRRPARNPVQCRVVWPASADQRPLWSAIRYVRSWPRPAIRVEFRYYFVAVSNHGAEYSAERPSGARLLVHVDVIRLSGYGIDGPGYPPYLSR